MNKQIQECPVITAKEYDKCYFLVHRAYAYFFESLSIFSYFFGIFQSKNHSFSEKNYNIIEDLLEKLYMRNYFNEDDKSRLINIFRDMKNTEK